MKKTKQIFLCLILSFSFYFGIHQQIAAQNKPDRFKLLRDSLDKLSDDVIGLDELIDVSINQVNITDFLRGVSKTNAVNISVDPTLDIKITSSFTKVRLKDLLIFLCKTYDLDIQILGNILIIKKLTIPLDKPKIDPPYIPNITYSQSCDCLSLDLKSDTLSVITKILSKLTGKNIIYTQDLNNTMVNGFIQNASLEQTLEKLGMTNGFNVVKTYDGFYYIDKKSGNKPNEGLTETQKNQLPKKSIEDSTQLNIEIDSIGMINISGTNVPIQMVIDKLVKKAKLNYFNYNEIKGLTTLNLKNISLLELLLYLFKGTTYSFRYDNSIYFFGEQQAEGVKESRLFKFQNRSVEKIADFIPAEIKKGIDIKEFQEQNSLIISGPLTNIINMEQYLRDVDKLVPMIIIEVLIVDSKTGHTTKTGLEAGIKDKASVSGGKLYPEVNYNLNAASINSLINSFNGYGVVKLGKVTENFYFNIGVLEDQGIVKKRSTPKLATLNGHEATMTLGNTEYYLEESNNVIGSQNPQNIITKQYKSVKADFTLKIKPIISGNEQITLDIKVEQSDFTGRISPQAPPGAVTRNFESMIRVKNEEMILLGGLEAKSLSDAGSGVPLLGRIPILKWFFSSRTKERSSTKLNIFIKAIIVY
ncbi:MAG: type II and III secretion system protein [Bacteroidetes bacterium]|nr:type II and III secretion system protein [Bacteroidota bacterium]